jgi:hypothetical protein
MIGRSDAHPMGGRPTLDRTHVKSLFTAQRMSRHARHRSADARRVGPAGYGEGPSSVRLPAPETAPARLSPPTGPPDAVIPAASLPMAALHVPTTTTGVLVEAAGGPPGGLAGRLAGGGCTPAQLRRFIKSRAYLPVHEIRRRFGIESEDDDVTAFEIESGRVFVGLPLREGRILGDLVRAGEVGYELQLDPEAPIIVGVYPMRPVTRQ